MPTINVTLYGDIAHYGSGKHIAIMDLDLPDGAVIDTLLQEISLPSTERGYLFVNAVLYDTPGLFASKNELLQNGDHVGIFSIRHMWPYQYRDGIRMSDSLKAAMEESGPIRNTYRKT
ncbi:MAG: hypothetical protein KAU23_05770 [Anaerolineales bacterium]|nr:hypothetical protein [Anaerolineales bacterium]